MKKTYRAPPDYVWGFEREWLGWYIELKGLKDGVNICLRKMEHPDQEEQPDGEPNDEEERVGGSS